MFEIICKELTPERKAKLRKQEVARISVPVRVILAAGGAYLVYSNVTGDVPLGFQTAAAAFIGIGAAAILMAVFSQKFVAARYFAKSAKSGCFPNSVSAGEGGVFVRQRNAERFYSYAEIGKIEDIGDYFKMSFLSGDTPGVYLFKQDFESGADEFILSFSKRRASSETE